jgi:hypothetical protein
LGVGLFANKFRLAARFETRPGRKLDDQGVFSVTLGFQDINGNLFHILSAMAK